jgi:hypothetical protein
MLPPEPLLLARYADAASQAVRAVLRRLAAIVLGGTAILLTTLALFR